MEKRVEQSMAPESRDRVQGILLGLAAGDRNGGPIRMAVRLAESLAEKRGFEPDDIFGRYFNWWREGGFDTGPVAARVFRLVASGTPYREAAACVHQTTAGFTAGCNPAHRSPPLAMAAFLAEGQLATLAAEEASLTHCHALAGDVAAATVLLCRHLARGVDWEQAVARAAHGRMEQTQAALLDPTDRILDRGGFAPEALRAAVFFLSTHDQFEMALCAALGFAGAANYCPVLVGAIGGARWGASEIPLRMLPKSDIAIQVNSVASALGEMW